MRTRILACLIAALAFVHPLLLGSDIEAPSLKLRIEDAVTHTPIADIMVYRFYQTVRVQHFLGIKGIPSPESEFEFRVSEFYISDKNGEVRLPLRRVDARLYERGVGDMLYINLIAPSSNDDPRDTRAFERNIERVLPNLHFGESITQKDPKYSGVVVHLNISLPDDAPRFDGTYAWFSLKRTGDCVVIGLAPAKDGKVDGQLTKVTFIDEHATN